ncbi:MAG: hypothetical protein U0531_18110 [Dehalococcoidia bacterium]
MAVAEQLTVRDRVKIDGAGYPVDVEVSDSEQSAGVADAGVAAAVAALPRSRPPEFRSADLTHCASAAARPADAVRAAGGPHPHQRPAAAGA